jgi:hypothetical protein
LNEKPRVCKAEKVLQLAESNPLFYARNPYR